MTQLEQYGVSERFQTEAAQYPQWTLGRVTAQHRGLYKIVTEEGEHSAQISGRLRYDTQELAQYPAVGDFVMASLEAGDTAVIHAILTRKSVFLRTAVGVTGQAQPVAANVDYVFICMSLNSNFNLSRLERYLSVAWDSGATPVVLLTKADLCENLPDAVSQAERAASFAEVIALSVLEEDAVLKLEKYLRCGATVAFIGSSGVGKSTLINRILQGQVLRTQEIGKADKGRHTTTGREMFVSPYGGVLIDTPGMRELGAEGVDLSKSFGDIDALALRCRFKDCTHTSEPGCAVLEALAEGGLDQRRLDNYFKLRNEAGYEGLNSKEIEAKKLERMFKDVGGIKGARKITKGSPKR